MGRTPLKGRGKVGTGGKVGPGEKGLGKSIDRDKYRRKVRKDSIHGICLSFPVSHAFYRLFGGEGGAGLC